MTAHLIDFKSYKDTKKIVLLNKEEQLHPPVIEPLTDMSLLDDELVEWFSRCSLNTSLETGCEHECHVSWTVPMNTNDSKVVVYSSPNHGYTFDMAEIVSLDMGIVEVTLLNRTIRVLVIAAEAVEISFTPPVNTLVIFTNGGIAYRTKWGVVYKSMREPVTPIKESTPPTSDEPPAVA